MRVVRRQNPQATTKKTNAIPVPQLSIRRDSRSSANGYLRNALACADGRLCSNPYPVDSLGSIRAQHFPRSGWLKQFNWIGMVGPTHCPTDDDCWLYCIVRLSYDAQCVDGVD